MAVTDLPDPHVRLIFAVMLYRGELISEGGFRGEVVSAFGPSAGHAIADRLVMAFEPSPT